jgi:hypothetical protein
LAHYRVYYLNAQGRIEGVSEIDAATDEAAVEHARTLLARRANSSAFELWSGARRIHAELKKA